ncbi:MAG: hypothetical protein IPO58_24980 [Betaproteobacteria bacterium]|nr:hypothetical protein [Betaproteobacteria bacterium]MBK8741403.1 hypothetical protein [Betaproteobacteria bacterium]MBK9609486.1 hypothetical protein [Betaproteobacteria bacterium]
MSKYLEHFEYDDLEAIIARARMERSVALGNAIAGGLSMVFLGIGRGVEAIRSAVSGAKSQGGASAHV